MPEMPEVQAHAERLSDEFAGRVLTAFRPIKFTALKTALPAPDDAYGLPLQRVGRRGKYLLLEFEPVHFAVPAADALTSPPLDKLGPEASEVSPDELVGLFGQKNQRLHGFLRDQRSIAGLGRRLANEVCHRAKVSPFAMTGKLGLEGATKVVDAIAAAVEEGLEYERTRPDMSSSKDRPGGVHHRAGEACTVCGDEVRAVEYSGYTVNYCATCQTNGKVLADNTTSKFLK